MKSKIIFLLPIMFVLQLSSIIAQNGFTNKEEAKNELVNGLKQGKWIEYVDPYWKITTKDSSKGYLLTVYKDNKPQEIQRGYYIIGKLWAETPYADGKINGIKKEYYESGKILGEITYTDGKINGINKWYYESGKIYRETPYTYGTRNGIEKWYFENGKILSETNYVNGEKIEKWWKQNSL